MRLANDVTPPELPEAPRPRRRAAPVIPSAHVALAIGAVIGLTLLARVALDLFLLLVLVAVVGVLRRTAGDWLGDLLGLRGGTIVFAAVVGLGGWWLVGTDGGRASVGQFFSAAGRLGFDNVLQERVIVPPSTRPATSSVPARSIAPSPAAGTAGSSAVSPRPAATERAGGGRGEGAPVIPTRLSVRATTTAPNRVVLSATLSAAGSAPDGRVEFRIDGRVVASARVGTDGNAETTVSLGRSGSYRVQARYAGSDRFGPAAAETGFTL